MARPPLRRSRNKWLPAGIGSPLKILGSTAVQRAHVQLVHTHLPKLQENGILTVNWEENEISLTDGEKVAQLFDAAEELESWPPDDLLELSSRDN